MFKLHFYYNNYTKSGGPLANPISSSSKLYEKLLEAYNTQDKRVRFESCYQLVDQAEYIEIHYVISMLKEFNSTGDTSSLPLDHLEEILNPLTSLFAGNAEGRRAFLLDILEEARERKRP